MGGKSKLASYIVNLIPKDIKIFVELFVGGGSVFFKRDKDPNILEVINDIDIKVYKIFIGLQNTSNYINNNINRKIDYDYYQSIKNKKDAVSLLEVAKSSFYGQHHKGFTKSKDKIVNIKTDFSVYPNRLKNVVILNKDFRKVINTYNETDAFFYFDPPYEKADINNDYLDYVEPIDVFTAVKNIKGRFIISYNDSSNIRNIFKDYNITEVKTKYSLSKTTINELIITNYNF
jgi:DNA adenine methylase